MNTLRTLNGFAVFMILFIGGAAIGGDYGAIGGFVIGVAAMMAIAIDNGRPFFTSWFPRI